MAQHHLMRAFVGNKDNESMDREKNPKILLASGNPRRPLISMSIDMHRTK